MLYIIHLSDDRQFAVTEEKLEDAKVDLAQYSADGILDVEGPYHGFEIHTYPSIDPQEFD